MKTVKRVLCILFCVVIFAFTSIPSAAAGEEVIVGGCLFGVKMFTEGVPIVGLEGFESGGTRVSPARDSGLKIKDVIKKINDSPVVSSADVTRAVSESEGKSIKVEFLRGNSEMVLTVTPKQAPDGIYRIGVWLRDSAAGIGTVTYVNPQTLEFGGLGHGICDSRSLALMPLRRGVVSDVELSGIVKGKSGAPGEINGSFKGGKLGALTQNTSHGVYGVFVRLPEGVGEKLPLAASNEICEGDAVIRCAVSGNIRDYAVRISRLDLGSGGGKNFVIEVIDPMLLEITGGIVQGMSGSPVIQNGKLIGAVTHVMINSPQKGYGIFIGNMM